MIKEESRFQDSPILEGMNSIRAVIEGNEAGTNDRKIIELLVDRTKTKALAKELGWLKHVGERLGFPIRECDSDEIASLSIGSTHGGLLAVCSARTVPPLTPDVVKPNGFYVMIEGIEDPYNFGYALRSLYAAGVDAVILTERNWLSAAGVVARSSAGTPYTKSIPHSRSSRTCASVRAYGARQYAPI